ncbi:MAG: biotin--[acetyl-CoA-carboxylase] ligase [Caldilineaceae bacterium]|nr:biotin--[acetyl-CoA-carboxylase] ligase [Caldilineaceae bacterium]
MGQADMDLAGAKPGRGGACHALGAAPEWIGRARARLSALAEVGSRRHVGHCIVFYSSVPSTMPIARGIFDERGDRAAGAVVIADHQTAGRGRLDRGWEDVRGRGLLGSYILCGELLPEHASLAVMLAGLAVLRAIGGCCPQLAERVRLKWPNDVIALGAGGPVKLAGVLVESIFAEQEIRGVILGIGINVNQREEELPSIRGGGLPPSSLALLGYGGNPPHAGYAPLEREELLVALCRALDDLCAAGSRPSAEAVHARWQRALYGLGAEVRAHTADGAVRGRAVGTSAQGALRVRVGRGETVEIHSGEVIFNWKGGGEG